MLTDYSKTSGDLENSIFVSKVGIPVTCLQDGPMAVRSEPDHDILEKMRELLKFYKNLHLERFG